MRSSVPLRVVLLSADDARAFLDGPHAAREADVVTLSPAARSVLIAAGRSSRHGERVFGTLGHGIAAVEARRAFDEIRDLMTSAGLPDDMTVSVSFLHYTWSAISVRMWRSIGLANAYVVPVGSALIETRDRTTAHDHLMRAALDKEFRRWPTKLERLPLAGAYRLFRAILLKAARATQTFVATPSDKMRFGLKNAVGTEASGLAIAVIRPSSSPWLDLAGIAMWTLRRNREGSLHVPLIPAEAGVVLASFEAVLSQVRSPVGRRVLAACCSELTMMARFVACYGADANAPMRQLRPNAVIVHESNELHGAVACGAATRNGIHVINVNNNSLPPQTGRISASVMTVITESRISARLTDTYVGWSPLTAGSTSLQPSHPTVVPTRELQKPWHSPHGTFRVLYASNSPESYQFYPHIIETSDEFADALAEFIATVPGLDGIESIIRLRNKGEFNPELLATISQNHRQVKITGVDTPFLDALAQADLLVSFMSSTIEQALQARIPVLLWGPTWRHVHLPARIEPPTESTRDAVYVAHDAAHLRTMLMAIRDRHIGAPLTDEETAGLVWPAATAQVHDAVLSAIERPILPGSRGVFAAARARVQN